MITTLHLPCNQFRHREGLPERNTCTIEQLLKIKPLVGARRHTYYCTSPATAFNSIRFRGKCGEHHWSSPLALGVSPGMCWNLPGQRLFDRIQRRVWIILKSLPPGLATGRRRAPLGHSLDCCKFPGWLLQPIGAVCLL